MTGIIKEMRDGLKTGLYAKKSRRSEGRDRAQDGNGRDRDILASALHTPEEKIVNSDLKYRYILFQNQITRK